MTRVMQKAFLMSINWRVALSWVAFSQRDIQCTIQCIIIDLCYIGDPHFVSFSPWFNFILTVQFYYLTGLVCLCLWISFLGYVLVTEIVTIMNISGQRPSNKGECETEEGPLDSVENLPSFYFQFSPRFCLEIFKHDIMKWICTLFYAFCFKT